MQTPNSNLPKFYIGQNAQQTNFGYLMKYLHYDINKQHKEFDFKNAFEAPVSTDQSTTMQYSRVAALNFINLPTKPRLYKNIIGDKRYELSNHLGNVLSVVSDRKLLNFELRGIPVLVANMESGANQPFLPTTPETQTNLTQNALQVTTQDRGQGVKTSVDLNQNSIYTLSFDLDVEQYKGMIELSLRDTNGEAVYKEAIGKTDTYTFSLKNLPTATYDLVFQNLEGEGTFEIDQVELTDVTLMRETQSGNNNYLAENAIFVPDVLSYNDYYPFGMLVPSRHENSSTYRYGFQGQELDNEIKGEGNSINYTFRMHDPRVGRFFAVDPLTAKYPWYTPYSFSGNKVINSVEVEGKEDALSMTWINAKLGLYGETTQKVCTGVEDGVKSSISGTWDFFTKDAYKKETWLSMAQFSYEVISSASPLESAQPKETPLIDTTVETFDKNVIHGDAYTRSKFGAQLTTDITIGILADKGLGSLSEVTGVTKLLKITPRIFSRNFIIGPKTYNTVSNYLEKMGFMEAAENKIMMDRMKKIMNKELDATEIDKNFAKHELRESQLVDEFGIDQEKAHEMTLKEQDMYHPEYDKKLYTQEALDAGATQEMLKVYQK